MKTRQRKKLVASFLPAIFFGTILVFDTGCRKETITTASSPIIYTDINPDSAINGNSKYNLDLNKDGTYDFIFNAFSRPIKCSTRSRVNGVEYGTNVTIRGGSNNGIIYVLNPNYAACLDSLTIINDSSQWSYVSSQALTMYVLTTV